MTEIYIFIYGSLANEDLLYFITKQKKKFIKADLSSKAGENGQYLKIKNIILH